MNSRFPDCIPSLNRFVTSFAGTDSDAVIHWQDENLAVANFAVVAATSALQDRLNRGFDEFFIDGNLQLHFAQQVDAEFGAAIVARLALLATEALAIQDSQSINVHLRQRFFDRFQFAGLNDGDDQFHGDVGATRFGNEGWRRDSQANSK